MDEKNKNEIKTKVFIVIGLLLMLGIGIAVGINLAVQPEQDTTINAETGKEVFNWNQYLGAWCDQGNEDNAESPKELYQVELKSVDKENQTVILNAACYEGRQLAIEENLEGIIHNNSIEIGFYDSYGSWIEGEITLDTERLFVSLNEVPEKKQESEISYGTLEKPLEINCIMVRDNCANIRDSDRSIWDTATLPETEKQAVGAHNNLIAEYSEDYIFPDSDKAYLSLNYLRHCTKQYLAFGRNEIFARHGRKFADQNLQMFFEIRGASWYHPTLSPEEFEQKIVLNEYEQKNLSLIQQVEAELSEGKINGNGFIGVADQYQGGSAPMRLILVKEIYDDHVVVDISVGNVDGGQSLECMNVNCKIVNNTTVSGEIAGMGSIQIVWKGDEGQTIIVSSPDNEELQGLLGFTYWGKTTNFFSS